MSKMEQKSIHELYALVKQHGLRNVVITTHKPSDAEVALHQLKHPHTGIEPDFRDYQNK